ncbi:MAG TPA: class IV adenylate cyclase [bacterium]|nr:class IV adenylate cyclase [bacterium]
MHEVEVKILDIDRAAVEGRLAALGAELCFDGRLDASFFDFPTGHLGLAGSLLRLRQEGNRAVLTFKRRTEEEGAKVREENEVAVADFDACRKLLEAMGMIETSRVEKHRTSYRLGPATVVIDRYVGELSFIPEFVEVEAESVDAVRFVAAQLGFARTDLQPWGLAQLIEYYRSAAGGLT